MTEEQQPAAPRTVFCSYSGADRPRVTGLALLLEALSYEVFLDHKTIKPGARWSASLQEGLDHADVLLVYWTTHAAHSDWVRREVEYFHTRYPNRLLIPDHRGVEMVSQLTVGQAILMGIAAASGAVVCNLSDSTYGVTVKSPAARIAPDRSPAEQVGGDAAAADLAFADAWLGEWSGISINESGQDVGRFSFEVTRVCDDYRIATNTSTAAMVRLLHISAEALRFLDKSDTRTEISLVEDGRFEGSFENPDPVVDLGIARQFRIRGKKSRAIAAIPCDES